MHTAGLQRLSFVKQPVNLNWNPDVLSLSASAVRLLRHDCHITTLMWRSRYGRNIKHFVSWFLVVLKKRYEGKLRRTRG